jgi:hypothetical protein
VLLYAPGALSSLRIGPKAGACYRFGATFDIDMIAKGSTWIVTGGQFVAHVLTCPRSADTIAVESNLTVLSPEDLPEISEEDDPRIYFLVYEDKEKRIHWCLEHNLKHHCKRTP